jgi:GrpB-like predicted nucleotidyltransferase (UPF0157 family)
MILDNRTHRAFAFRRTGKKSGRLRWSGLGHIGTTRPVEEIADKLAIDVDTVRRVLGFATAHLFVEMVPHHGGTGYYCLLPKDAKRPLRVPEPDDPREDEADNDDADAEQN